MKKITISKEIELPDWYNINNFNERDNIEVDFEVSLDDVLNEYDEDNILKELGYDPSICFKTDFDLKNEVYGNSEFYDIELKPYFKYANDNDIYDRVLYLLESDRINYNEWDNFLRKYEI